MCRKQVGFVWCLYFKCRTNDVGHICKNLYLTIYKLKYNEFSGLNFSYEEWNELQIDQKFLANGKELIAGVNKCISIIDEGDISLNSLSREAQVELKNLHALDTRLENANNIMNSIQAESLELARELSNYLQNVDIDENFLTIDENKIESKISKKTKCILATHVFGNPCNIDRIQEIAYKHNLLIIYDAAHCFGVKYNNNSS